MHNFGFGGSIFKKNFDNEIYQLILRASNVLDPFNLNDTFETEHFSERIDYDLYETLDEDTDKRKIVKKEIKRLKKEYSSLAKKGKLTIDYSDRDWFDEIHVLYTPGFGAKLEKTTNNCINLIESNYFKKFLEYDNALKFVTDFDFSEHEDESSSGRSSIIALVSSSKDLRALPNLRKIVLDDPSINCRHEALKGLYHLKDDEGMRLILDKLPTLRFYPYLDFTYSVLTLANGVGIKNLENEIVYLLEYFIKDYINDVSSLYVVDKNTAKSNLIRSDFDFDTKFMLSYGIDIKTKTSHYRKRKYIEDTLSLLGLHNIDASIEFLKSYYPSPYTDINIAIENSYPYQILANESVVGKKQLILPNLEF